MSDLHNNLLLNIAHWHLKLNVHVYSCREFHGASFGKKNSGKRLRLCGEKLKIRSGSFSLDHPLLGGRSLFMHVVVQYFSVNFHFLNNAKSYSRDFFTIDTIGYGLSFDDIERTFPLKFFQSPVHTIFRKCLYICIRT